MSELLNGVHVVSPIVPMTTEDVYPTHIANYGKGGYHIVDTIEKLNAIPRERLVQGTAAYVNQDNLIYTLRSSDESIANGDKLEWEVTGSNSKIYVGLTDVSTDGQVYPSAIIDTDGNVTDWGNALEGNEGDFYLYKNPENAFLNSTGYVRIKIQNQEETKYVWASLAGNVNAENVYFKNGIQRTEAWGTFNSTNGEIVNECVGFNLKELLENYLVKEDFPNNVTTTYGITSTKNDSTISNSNNYLDITDITNVPLEDITVDIGTEYMIKTCSYTPNIITQDGSNSSTIGDVYITNIDFGYFETIEDATNNTNKIIPEDKRVKIYDARTINYTYTNNVNEATNIYNINVEGFNDKTNTAIVIGKKSSIGNTPIVISDNEYPIYVRPGTNYIKVEFLSNANITQTITNPESDLTFSEGNPIWLATNKGNGKKDGSVYEYTPKEKKVTISRKVKTLPPLKGTVTTGTIIGAWKIYSNAGKFSYTEFTTEANIQHENTDILPNEFITIENTFYISWYNTDEQYVYIPTEFFDINTIDIHKYNALDKFNTPKEIIDESKLSTKIITNACGIEHEYVRIYVGSGVGIYKITI